MKEIYDKVCQSCSITTTKSYSTSFSLGVRFLSKEIRPSIYAIYGFVRFADEIVDTFHEYDKQQLLTEFEHDTWKAIDRGISMNPILESFQRTVNQYGIDRALIKTFLQSMEMDLYMQSYNTEKYEEYILGSAEVVGLMCLKVFVNGNQELYHSAKPKARRLGSAFQKINFLRDLKDDYFDLGRTYFPGIDMSTFDDHIKDEIEKDIEKDFQAGYEGIMLLPKSSQLGVYVAYIYYYNLFNKIRRTPSNKILEKRVRIPNNRKFTLFVESYFRHRLNLL